MSYSKGISLRSSNHKFVGSNSNQKSNSYRRQSEHDFSGGRFEGVETNTKPNREGRSFDRSGRPVRSFGDRPQGEQRRSFGDRPNREGRSFDRSDRPARSFGDRAQGGERRSCGDRPNREGRSFDRSDRPARSFGDRAQGGERRSFGDRPNREGRSFDRLDRTSRSFGDRAQGGERRSFGDRPNREGRSFDRSDRPSRSFGNRPQGGDRSFDRNDKPNSIKREGGFSRGETTVKKRDAGEGQRIQKVLANLGYGSRRNLEQLISEGKVTLNGKVVLLGDVIYETDKNLDIEIDGQRVYMNKDVKCRVIAYNKREGEASTNNDQLNRSTVFNRLPRIDDGRWVQVGRLDINTNGLLLFTTDGELAHRLMHPSYQVERSYLCRIYGDVTGQMLYNLTQGVKLEDGMAKFDNIKKLEKGFGANNYYLVTLHSGRNHEVKRLWESQGVVVSRLSRASYAGYELDRRVPMGGWIELDGSEINDLRNKVELAPIKFKTYRAPAISRSEEKRQEHVKMRQMRQAINKDRQHQGTEVLARAYDPSNLDKNSLRRNMVEEIRQRRRENFIADSDFN